MARSLAMGPPLLSLALAQAACGGVDAGRPSGEVPPAADAGATDPCLAMEGLVFQNIVDFEGAEASCDPFIRPSANQGAQCLYFNYDNASSPHPCGFEDIQNTCFLQSGSLVSDATCAKSNPGIGPLIANTAIEGGNRCTSSADGGPARSNSALHLVGDNLAICMNPITMRQGWGASLAVQFNLASGGGADHPLDASAWDGISFWVKNGHTPDAGKGVLAGIQDPYTALPPPNPRNADGSPVYPPGYCSTAATGVADAEKCDPFGLAVLLTDNWRFIRVSFDRLQQKGFGKPTPSGKLEVSALTGLQFVVSAGTWDFWLDDIAFYRKAN